MNAGGGPRLKMSSDRREGLAQLAHPTDADELFGRGYPNPDRVGCPPREVLVSLARRERPIDDPAYDHLKECSPCYLEGRAIQQADALQQRRRILTWAAAAALILSTGSATWFWTTRENGVASSGTRLRAELDLRPYAITRGEPQTVLPPLVLPRGDLMLTLLLPTGSEPGQYEVQVKDSNATTRASARGNAELRQYVSTLEVAVSVGELSPGMYSLAVRRDGNEWQQFPVRLE
jgi:hypothetical protein